MNGTHTVCVYLTATFPFLYQTTYFQSVVVLQNWYVERWLMLAVGLQVCNVYKFHLSCSTRPPQLIEMVLKKWHADSFSRDDIDRYVLKVAGREEYLVSDDKMLRQYIVRVE